MTSTETDTHRIVVAGVETASRKSDSQHQRLPLPEPSRPPSFAAFLADAFFLGDLSIALAAPLVMLGSIARSLDPRVGGAFDQRLMTSPVCAAHHPQLPEAREDFPYGSRAITQVLHVARHLVWYTLVRPARHGDWAGLFISAINWTYTCMVLLLAVCPRRGPVWGWWRRHRIAFLSINTLLARCVLMVSTFLLLPPAAWPTHAWAGYVVSASSRPLANALALSVYDQLVKVPLTAVCMHALAQTAGVFLLAYLVAPTIATMQRQQLQPNDSQASGMDSIAATGPVPLQCGLRPEHSALLPCRPLALQVLLGLAMVAWPVWLSWAVERRLRRQHAELCAAWRRKQLELLQEQQPQPPGCDITAGEQDQQQQRTPQSVSSMVRVKLTGAHHCSGPAFDPVGSAYRRHGREVNSETAPAGPIVAAPAPAAAADGMQRGGWRSGQPLSSGASALPPTASTRYRSTRGTVVAAVKVQVHPGGFEEYGNHMASVLHDAVREQFAVAAADLAGPAVATTAAAIAPADATMVPHDMTGLPSRSAETRRANAILHTTVIRGCVQAVLWGWVPEGPAGGGAEGDAAAAQRLLQRLAVRLGDPELAGDGAGGVRGVSVQVGQAVAVAQGAGGLAHVGEGERVEEEEVPAGQAEAAFSHCPSSSSSGVARLLRMDPPAASLRAAGAAASDPLTVRLLLHSPAPQPARVLVLAERQGAGGAVAPRAVLLREVAVALEGGVQEVEVELGPGEVAGGVAGRLRVMLVGPVHMSQGAESGQEPRPPPLVQWVAPPLLLLPEEAAGELCGLWEQMKREQVEDQEGLDQEQPEQAVPDVSLPHAPAPTGPVAALAGVEQESSLWWSHMAPLMGDLAYALSAWHGQDQEAEGIKGQLLEFLYSNGLHCTAALLQQPPSCNGSGIEEAVPFTTASSVPTVDAAAPAADATAATPAAAAPATAGGGLPEPTALRALQLELGLRRWPPGQEAAYREHARQRASPHLLTLVDVACFVIMVARSALGRLPAGSLVTALLATWVGVVEVTVWAWAPSGRRRGGGSGRDGGGGLWRRLREPSPQDVVLWHCGSHMLAKLLCALGVSAPPGIEAYVCGPGALVYEGLLMPVCKLMPFRVALPLSFIRTVLNAGMIYTVGRRSVLFACSWALLVSCAELTTTLAMHTWLGRGFLARRRTKMD